MMRTNNEATAPQVEPVNGRRSRARSLTRPLAVAIALMLHGCNSASEPTQAAEILHVMPESHDGGGGLLLRLDDATYDRSSMVEVFFATTDALSCDDGASINYIELTVGDTATVTLPASLEDTDADVPQVEVSEVVIDCP